MALDKKLEEEKEDILALGKKHEERVEKSKKRKVSKIPILMMIFGFILMVIGYFYIDIATFLGAEFSKLNKEEKKTSVVDSNVLICNKKSENKTLGIMVKSTYSYTFKDKKLKKMKEVRTLSPMKYSDIGPHNVRIFSERYSALLEGVPLIDGFSASSKSRNDSLMINIYIDFQKMKVETFPQNDLIQIDYHLNEERSSVRQKIAKDKDTLCE